MYKPLSMFLNSPEWLLGGALEIIPKAIAASPKRVTSQATISGIALARYSLPVSGRVGGRTLAESSRKQAISVGDVGGLF